MHGDMRRAGALLATCGEGRLRRLLSGVYVLAVLAAGAALLWLPKPEKAPMLALALVAIATGFAWVFWFSRVVLVALDARDMQLPHGRRDACNALILALAVAAMVPALLLVVAGADASLAFPALACVALAGLVFAWLPGWAASAVCFLPMVLQQLEWSIPGGSLAVSDLWWLAMLLGLVAVLRWRAILRAPAWPSGVSFARPLVIGLGQPAKFGAGVLLQGDLNRQFAALPSWMAETGRVGSHGPQSPVTALRVWLGSPFAPMSWPRRLGHLAFVFGTAALYPLVMRTHVEDPGAFWALALAWVGVFGGMIVALMFPLRLAVLTQRNAGEWAELAVLPGFPDAARARGILLRAVAGPPAVAFAGLLLVSLAVAPLVTGIDGPGVALLLAAGLALVLVTAVGCLSPLAGIPLSLPWLVAFLVLGLPLLLASVFVALERFRTLGGIEMLPTLFAGWTLACAFLGTLLFRAWRRFQRRPHPFLQG